MKSQLFEALKLKQMGRDFFDVQAPKDVPELHLKILPGYKTSIRQHENGIMLNVEVAHIKGCLCSGGGEKKNVLNSLFQDHSQDCED